MMQIIQSFLNGPPKLNHKVKTSKDTYTTINRFSNNNHTLMPDPQTVLHRSNYLQQIRKRNRHSYHMPMLNVFFIEIVA